MPFTRTRAVMVAGLALLAGAAMYSDAVAQGLVANPRYSCFQLRVPGRWACQPKHTFPHPTYEHTYLYQQTFQSPFQPHRRPPGVIQHPPR
jgi:hypothetical protein